MENNSKIRRKLSFVCGFFKNHKITAIIAILFISFGGYFGYEKINKDDEIVSYKTTIAAKGSIVSSVSGSGQISASNKIDIKPKVSGDIVYVGIKPGHEVKSGDLLFRIDSSEAQKKVRDAKTDLETASLAFSSPSETNFDSIQHSQDSGENNVFDSKRFQGVHDPSMFKNMTEDERAKMREEMQNRKPEEWKNFEGGIAQRQQSARVVGEVIKVYDDGSFVVKIKEGSKIIFFSDNTEFNLMQ